MAHRRALRRAIGRFIAVLLGAIFVAVLTGWLCGGEGGLHAAEPPASVDHPELEDMEGIACSECHEDPGFIEQAAPVEHPDLEDLGEVACTECHDDLLGGKVQHAPAADGECDSCHEMTTTENGTTVSLSMPIGELCVFCHDDVAEALGRPQGHGAIQVFGCAVCHDPHASNYPLLLRREGKDLCQECHLGSSLERSPGGGPVPLFGKRLVPSAAFDKVPKVPIRAQDVRGHPVAKHPLEAGRNPLRPEEPFWCASCHEPHAAVRKSLLIGPAKGSFCLQCHRK